VRMRLVSTITLSMAASLVVWCPVR
jgi:hypothetical protein